MNKRGSDGRGSCKVYGVTDMMEVVNVVVTGTGDGGDLLEKEVVESKMKSRFLAEGVCKIN